MWYFGLLYKRHPAIIQNQIILGFSYERHPAIIQKKKHEVYTNYFLTFYFTILSEILQTYLP